jgi:glycosyltransferase involved in cell wall biosynthesis
MKEILPVVVFAFNRPHKLKRILEALRPQPIDRMVIFVDGPRHASDLPQVEASRSLARGVDWAPTELHLWEDNRGLNGFIDNISLVMEAYRWAIFVEDDCLPMLGYCQFMRQALERYNDCPEVFSIGGYQPLAKRALKDYPYSLISSARFHCWGWASWRDRWQKLVSDVRTYAELFDGLQHVPEIAGPDLPFVARAMATGATPESWDTKVAIACLNQRLVHLEATRGLVRNIGLDYSGMHGSRVGVVRDLLFQNRNLVREMPDDLPWPERVELNCEYADALREWIYRGRRFSLQNIKRFVAIMGRRYIWPRKERLFALNLVKAAPDSLKKRALLSYITHPFFIQRDELRFYNHINIAHAQALARVLNRMGYLVDVIGYRDRDFVPQSHYDLFIGHMGVNFETLARQLAEGVKKLYLATTSYWRYHNEQEAARFAELRQRRGFDLQPDRRITFDEDRALRIADGVIGIGNAVSRATYADFPKVIMINGSTIYDDHFDWCSKDYAAGRQHFLYYTSGGCVHKGLDLLLEAFTGIQQHLWICSRFDEQFASFYSKELDSTPNIHRIGRIRPRTAQFYQLMRRCNFCILPSCSEGQAQSVIEAMNQGLIPVVSRASGLDVGDNPVGDTYVTRYGFFIEDFTVAGLRQQVLRLADLPPEECQALSIKARAKALNDFSEETFEKNLQAALEALLR